jgi:dehydrogenase/reductase SDR family protein 12
MSIYRKSVWFVKGLQEYTIGGYNSAVKSFKAEDLDGVSCKGKSYMITGANSGIGKETAMDIAKRGGTVHMVCRNPKTAEEAKQEIVKESNNDDVHVHILDMSEPKSVHKFAHEFQERFKALSCLVNNAGCMVNDRTVTEDGLEKNFATNTVGTYIITEALMPLIQKSEDPRVITVSSGGMLTQKLHLGDLQSEKVSPFEGTMVYSQQKRQQVVMTHEWAKKYDKVFFASMHPGWADTPAVRTSMPEFYEKMKNRLRTTAQGADTIIWLAVSPAATKEKSGYFFQDRKIVSEHLTLACTHSSEEDHSKLMEILGDYYNKFKQ